MVQTCDLGKYPSGLQEGVEIGGQGDIVGMWRARAAEFYTKYVATAAGGQTSNSVDEAGCAAQ